MAKPQLRVLSLGAGVQSTTMALMAAHGEFEHMPDCAIFADTQSEPKAVYDHLNWLMSDNVLPFPVHIVTRGNLGDQVLANVAGKQATGKRDTIPAFTTGKDGGAAPLARHCTNDFKIAPIEKKVRELAGIPKGHRHKGLPIVEQWIGISTDEAARMKPNPKRWAENRWPLIEKRMSRNDCLRWMERNGYPTPPKSACTFCPYHSNAMWRHMKHSDLVSWQEAVDFDAGIRSGFEGGNNEVFLHRSLKPLDEVDLTTVEDEGQINMFNDECEGMCGV
jgi:hypothetical protein